MKHKLPCNKQLSYLNRYMVEWIDNYPKKIKPFDVWLDSHIDTQKEKGKKAVLKEHKERCRYCARYFNDVVIKTKDHVVPTSRGGLNVKENRVFSCLNCNGWKADFSLESWLADLKRVLKKDKIRHPYDRNIIGIMIKNVNLQINETKQNRTKVSIYKSN